MTEPPTAAQRNRMRSPANLLRSLIPLVILVVIVVVITRRGSGSTSGVHRIDTAAPIAAAQQQVGFTLVSPHDLSAGWRPTSTQFVPAANGSAASFRIGYVTPTTRYAEFTESNDAPDAVAALFGPLAGTGYVIVNGSKWSSYQTIDHNMLLRETTGTGVDAVTVIVTGSASQAELVQLAGSLR